MKFWAIDSPVMRVLGRLGDIIILNMIFVVGCIPVITIGTSLSALYAVAMKMARGEDPSVWKEFWKAYKRNFRPATICWLVMAVIAILLFVDFRIIGVLKRGSESMYSIMRIVLAVILGMWMLMFQYLFPYIARFENGIFATLRNALLLAAAHIPSTIVIVGLSVGSLILTLFTSRSFVIASIIWVFFGFAVLAYVQAFLLCRIFVPIRFSERGRKMGNIIYIRLYLLHSKLPLVCNIAHFLQRSKYAG